MDPIIAIINYLFHKNNVKSSIKSLESFFENGVSFPLFISSIFKVQKIPKIIKNPKSKADKQSNNDRALQYLYKNNKIIGELRPVYTTLKDKEKLLTLIFKKQCFHINEEIIISQCNCIVKKLGILFYNINDLVTLSSLLAILNVLTDGKVQLSNESNSIDDTIIAKSFSDAKVPLVINKDLIDSNNPDFFLIQIKIIFDIFTDKLSQIDGFPLNSEDYLDYNIEILKAIEMRKRQERKNLLDKQETKNQEIEEEALLTTLNAIGDKKMHFKNFNDTIKNDSIPQFVIQFFQIPSIENVDIKPNKKSEKITKEQIRNIESVIEFIKTKEIGFKFLKFDFQSADTQISSAILFYSNFLNSFFVKNSRQNMYNRCAVLLCTKENLDSPDFYQLEEFRTYIALLHIIINKNLHFRYNSLPNDEKSAIKYFKNAKVPMIINEKILKNNWILPDSIFYQLQFIFNVFDNRSSHLNIIQCFLRTIYMFKNIYVPKFDVMAKNATSKIVSLVFQKSRVDQYLNRKITPQNEEEKSKKDEVNYTIKDFNDKREIKIKILSHKDDIPQDFGFDDDNDNDNSPNEIKVTHISDEDSIPQDFGFGGNNDNSSNEIKVTRNSDEDSIPQDFGFGNNNNNSPNEIKVTHISDEDSIPQDFGFGDDNNNNNMSNEIKVTHNSDEDSIPQDFGFGDNNNNSPNEIKVTHISDEDSIPQDFGFGDNNDNSPNEIKVTHISDEDSIPQDFGFGDDKDNMSNEIKVTHNSDEDSIPQDFGFGDDNNNNNMSNEIKVTHNSDEDSIPQDFGFGDDNKDNSSNEIKVTHISDEDSIPQDFGFGDDNNNNMSNEIKVTRNSDEDSIPQDFGFGDDNNNSPNEIKVTHISDEDSIPQDFGFGDDNSPKGIKTDKSGSDSIPQDFGFGDDNDEGNKSKKMIDRIDYCNNEDGQQVDYPKLYKERIGAPKAEFLKEEIQHPKLDSLENFWSNCDLDNMSYEKGIIHWIQQDDQTQKDWANEIENADTKIKVKTQINQVKKETQPKIYKIIHYDETSNKWCFNYDIYLQLLTDRHFNDDTTERTSLIFLMDSYEKDSISMVSKLLNSQISPIEDDDNQMFVYAISDVYSFAKSNDPIFLLLHVPKSKKKRMNFVILFQIYVFLSYICNLRIIILDKKNYINQIEAAKITDNIINMLPHSKPDYSRYFSSANNNNNDDNSNEDDDENDSNENDDDDDENEEEEIWENQNVVENEIDLNNFNDLTSKIINEDPEIIFLMKDSSIKKCKQIDNEDDFCSTIITKFTSKSKIHCINIKEIETYGPFLDSLTESFQNNNSCIYRITTNFQSINLIQSLHIDNFYIQLKISSDETYKNELKEKITKRYLNSNPDENNSYYLLFEIKKEINSIIPHYEKEILNYCNSVLKEIMINEIKKKQEFLSSELSKSSKLHLNYMKNVINSKKYWESEQENNFSWSHELFLKDEFLSIIQYSFPDIICDTVYEQFNDILQNQIKIGCDEINSIFAPFRMKMLRKFGHDFVDPTEYIGKGTNYKMKETEHTKEVKVMIEAGDDLKDYIPQDF